MFVLQNMVFMINTLSKQFFFLFSLLKYRAVQQNQAQTACYHSNPGLHDCTAVHNTKIHGKYLFSYMVMKIYMHLTLDTYYFPHDYL
jgi:hypothetical protein